MIYPLNIWQLIAGLSIFLFGMLQMEEGLKMLAGRSFRTFLRNNTKNRIRGVLIGIMLTAILQSSSVVSLLLLAFVGAGLISMKRALPVIFGSNLGTTVTGWIVTVLGFKLPIDEFSIPFIGIGGLILFFFKERPRYSNIGQIMLGFGFIFFGLDFMKESIEFLAQQFDLQSFSQKNILILTAAGAVLTALIQSSSAAMVIALSALHAQLITLPAAAALVVGANVGTTVTVLIGSIGSVPAKKRVAVAHFLFNVVTGIVALVFIPLLVRLITEVLEIQDPLYALTSFHTLFNLLGVLLFLPFVGPLAHFLEHRFEQPKTSANIYLDRVTQQVPEAALEALRKETHRLVLLVIYLNLKALKLPPHALKQLMGQINGQPVPKPLRHAYAEGYLFIKQLEGEMLKFYTKLQQTTLEVDESRQLRHLIQTINNTMHSIKGIKDIEYDLDHFEQTGKKYYLKLVNEFRDTSLQLYNEILQTLQTQHKTISLEELGEWRVLLQKNYDKLLGVIYQAIDNKMPDEIEISTVLNVNRELYSSHKAIILAVSDLLVTSISEYIEESKDIPHADI